MSLDQLTTIEAIQQFLNGTQAVAFSIATKGVITRYLIKITGYSSAQTKRLIRQYVQTGEVTVKLARNNGFKRAYTDADIRLLANPTGNTQCEWC